MKGIAQGISELLAEGSLPKIVIVSMPGRPAQEILTWHGNHYEAADGMCFFGQAGLRRVFFYEVKQERQRVA